MGRMAELAMTGRPERPVTPAVDKAERWGAKAVGGGGQTDTGSAVEGGAGSRGVGVAYRHRNLELVDLEEGYGVHQTRSWQLRCLDGYRARCVALLPLPQPTLDGRTVTADKLEEATVTQPSL